MLLPASTEYCKKDEVSMSFQVGGGMAHEKLRIAENVSARALNAQKIKNSLVLTMITVAK